MAKTDTKGDSVDSILRFFAEKVWEYGSYRHFFLKYDPDDRGGIDKPMFAMAADRMGVRLTEKELNAAFGRWDEDGDGLLSYDEFRRGVSETVDVCTTAEATLDIKIASRLKVPEPLRRPPGSLERSDAALRETIRGKVNKKYGTLRDAYVRYHTTSMELTGLSVKAMKDGLARERRWLVCRDGLDVAMAPLLRIVSPFTGAPFRDTVYHIQRTLDASTTVTCPLVTQDYALSFDEFQSFLGGSMDLCK